MHEWTGKTVESGMNERVNSSLTSVGVNKQETRGANSTREDLFLFLFPFLFLFLFAVRHCVACLNAWPEKRSEFWDTIMMNT